MKITKIKGVRSRRAIYVDECTCVKAWAQGIVPQCPFRGAISETLDLSEGTRTIKTMHGTFEIKIGTMHPDCPLEKVKGKQ